MARRVVRLSSDPSTWTSDVQEVIAQLPAPHNAKKLRLKLSEPLRALDPSGRFAPSAQGAELAIGEDARAGQAGEWSVWSPKDCAALCTWACSPPSASHAVELALVPWTQWDAVSSVTLTRWAFYFDVEVFSLIEAKVDDLVSSSQDEQFKAGLAIITKALDSPCKLSLSSASEVTHALRATHPAYPAANALALGAIKEAETSRALGHLSSSAVGRLVRCIKSLNLHNKTPRSLVDTQIWCLALAASFRYCEIPINGVIGGSKDAAAESSLRTTELSTILRVVSDSILVIPKESIRGQSLQVRVPGSKSVSNRALLLAGLSDNACTLTGLLHSDDTQVMLLCLERFGAKFEWVDNGRALRVVGNGGKLAAPSEPLWMGNAGTATRFVLTLCTLVEDAQHATILTGSHRMMERPQGALVDALRTNGVRVTYLEEKNGVFAPLKAGPEGTLPLSVQGGGFKGGPMGMSGKISSQYVSSVLLAAPYAKETLVLELAESSPTSISYIEMTLLNMKQFGVHVERLAVNKFKVPNSTGYRAPEHVNVEADASSATYALALAAVTGASVTLLGVGSESTQGDAGFFRVMERMGCVVSQSAETTTVTGPEAGKLVGAGVIDFGDLTDAFLTCVAVAAHAHGDTHITGIANQHVKECDRILAMCTELAKVGVQCDNLPDGIVVHGKGPIPSADSRVRIDTYDDHRVAMSLAVLAAGMKLESLRIVDKDCTDKTYPEFWDDWVARLGGEVRAPLYGKLDKGASLVLVGMRGAGKTTLGKVAAKALNYQFIDLDEVLVREAQAADASLDSCGAIVKAKGWPVFREMEAEVLRRALEQHKQGHVIATGGGYVEIEKSRRYLRASQLPVIHVQRDIADVQAYLESKEKAAAEQPNKRVKRTVEGTDERPSLGEPIPVTWARRRPLYDSLMHYNFQIPSSGGDHTAVAASWSSVEAAFHYFVLDLLVPLSPLDWATRGEAAQAVASADGSYSVTPLHGGVELTLHGKSLSFDAVSLIVSSVREAHPRSPILVTAETREALLYAVKNGCHAMRVPSTWSALDISELVVSLPPRWNELGVVAESKAFSPAYFQHNIFASVPVYPQTDRYYLFGHPIQTSPSPIMHNAGFELLGEGARKRYDLCDTRGDDLRLLRQVVHARGFQGASVTIPHKERVEAVLRSQGVELTVSQDAQRVGAINTLVRRGDRSDAMVLEAENTDWIAIRNLVRNQLPAHLKQGAVLVVGAGGTARAACHAVNQLGFELLVWNRTPEKAAQLAAGFNGRAVGQLSELTAAGQPTLLAIVSTVPSSAKFVVEPRELLTKNANHLVVMDASYRPKVTALIEQAQGAGVTRLIHGVDMLLEQGFEQMRIWHARSTDVAARARVELTSEVVKTVTERVMTYYGSV